MEKSKEDSIDVEVKNTELTNIKTPPKFTNNEIGLLYEMDLISVKKHIEKILTLPRKSLIDNLNLVLKDSIIRYNYFITEADSERSDDMGFHFVIHALFLLSEIEATESMENIFEVLRQDNDYLDFYLGDIMTEFVWMVLYKTAYLDLDKCKQFMFEPGIYTFSKSSVSEIVSQIAIHQPHRKKEAIDWFRDVFKFFLKSTLNDNVIDSSLLGILVDDVVDFDGIELMPEIEELFKKEIVDLDSCGDINEVKNLFAEESSFDHKKEILYF